MAAGSSDAQAEHIRASTIFSLGSLDRLDLLKQHLSSTVIDLPLLGRLACAGLPDGAGVRARVWQLLLGYLPPESQRWPETLQKRRAEYRSFCRDFMVKPDQSSLGEDDDPLSDAAGSSWKQYFEDQEGLEQIQRDVERTHQGVPFFADPDAGCEKHQQEMQRLLFVFSKLNPGLQYVQGMNELVAPLYMVFRVDAAAAGDAEHAEADAFFCFVKLLTMSENRDLYCKSLDKSHTGVRAVLQQFMKRLAAADPAVHAHLVEEQVDPQYFAFRWITVLFAHDIERLEEVQRVWDFLLGDPSGCKDAIMRFCAALVLRRRTQIMAAEYPEVVKVLQSCGRSDFDAEAAIDMAVSLSSQYLL